MTIEVGRRRPVRYCPHLEIVTPFPQKKTTKILPISISTVELTLTL